MNVSQVTFKNLGVGHHIAHMSKKRDRLPGCDNIVQEGRKIERTRSR